MTRVNGGHLVRIVGAGFELVRQWAETGMPLSVVFRGIDLKAERHRAGASKRPLRIEFCEDDVRDVFANWRRAVGVPAAAGSVEDPEPQADDSPKRPSLTRHLDRAIERLGRVAGRIELPGAFLDAVGGGLEELVAVRDQAKGARGPAREACEVRAAAVDERLVGAARAAAGDALLTSLADEAARELAPFRSRLAPGAWEQAIGVTVDRLLRDRFGLPTI